VQPVGVTIGRLATESPVRERWALWHITRACNIECDYCYGSFDGESYKTVGRAPNELTTGECTDLLSQLVAAGVDAVHINGGEPLLRPDIEKIVRFGRDLPLMVWLLTNGTVRGRALDALSMDGLTSLLAVSLDSHLPEINERNRERSERVRETVQLLSSRKDAGLLTCQLGVYVVVTRSNLPHLPAYASWLADTGVDYVNVQPVYLPAGHPSAEESILKTDAGAVAAFYSDLERRGLKTSSPTMQQIALASLEGVRGVATECFADRGDYFYISPSGVVTGCPVKSATVIGLGSTRGGRWVDGARRLARQGAHACNHLCGDCLGMYEMASGDHGVVHKS